MRVLVINNNTEFIEQIKGVLKGLDYEIISFKEVKFENIIDFTHIILTGGPERLDFDLFKEEVKIIKEADKPVLGICFGHQLILKVFGARLVKIDSKERRGFFDVVVKKDSIFSGLKEKISVFESHSYVMEGFGEELMVLAESDAGKEAIKHKSKNLYGVQFHPEAGRDGKKIIENFLKL